MADWQVFASEVKAGDRYRSLGPGFLARTVVSVTHQCNCEGLSHLIDPVTREPLHHPVVVIESKSETYVTRPEWHVWLTDSSF